MAEEEQSDKGKVVAVATLFPVGGILLTLAGLTLTATVVGLTAALPLFLLFSPVLVPAAMALGMALAGFLASGSMGLAAVRALSWLFGYVREALAPAKDVGGRISSRAS